MRLGPLQVALCALLLTGCTVGGPQGAGDQAGRQAPSAIPGDVATSTVMAIADRVRATGDLNTAITFYRRAIAIDTHNVPAYIGLGETLLAAGYPNEASEAFRSALSEAANESESPDHKSHVLGATRGLGLTLIALNQPIPAIEMLNKANMIEPSARAYGAIGIAEDLLDDADAADKAYKQGLALAPDDLDLLNNYGLSLALHGDFNNAITTLRRVASDSKAGARHRLNLAMALGLAGRSDDAAQVARIDLDERSVKSNLAYYATLRALPAQARATAILRPGAPLPAEATVANCEGSDCPKTIPPGDKLSAIPAAPVDAKPLPAPMSAKPATMPAPPSAKPTSLTPPATPKPSADPADTAEKKLSKPATSNSATAKAQSSAPTHIALAPKSPAPAPAEPPAPAPATVVHDEDKPAAPEAMPANSQPTPPVATVELPQPVVGGSHDEPATMADAKPPAKAEEMPLATGTSTPDAARADATPAAPHVTAAEPADMKPLQPEAASPPSAGPAETGDTPMKADATKPENDSSRLSDSDAMHNDSDPMHMAANDHHEPATTPQMPAPPPGGPVVKAAAVISPLPPGKHAWIQIASFRSEQNAQSAWKSMTNGNQDLLRYVPLSVRRVDLGAEKGVYYVLRIGPLADMSQARDLCTALKDRQITCVVAK